MSGSSRGSAASSQVLIKCDPVKSAAGYGADDVGKCMYVLRACGVTEAAADLNPVVRKDVRVQPSPCALGRFTHSQATRFKGVSSERSRAANRAETTSSCENLILKIELIS